MVTFEVGEGQMKETFLIHKEVACRGSVVFEKAFNSNFEEGLTQIYKLNDIDPDAFRFFSEWLYSEKLSLLDHEFESKEGWTDEEKVCHLAKCIKQDCILVELWVMGDRFAVKGLQNSVVGHMFKVSRHCGFFNATCRRKIYETTMPGSQLRRLVVAQQAWSTSLEYLAEYARGFHTNC
jgi:hypothetical protein